MKVAGALCNTNGITTNSYNPNGVANAVFSIEASHFGICQYPWARSRVEMDLAFPILLMTPWHWVSIEFCNFVELSVVNAETNSTIFLGYNYNW